MSFPRAKIKRFNEIPLITPSPADYNVDVKSKAKLVFIPQSDRFVEPKSPLPSETGSSQSTPCFRTPTLIKKKKLLGSASKLKFLSSKVSDKELLNEKTVECQNKDVFIKELIEQLDELKNNLYNLKSEKENLDMEKEKLELEITEIQALYKLKMSVITESHNAKIVKLDKEIIDTKNQLQTLIKQNEELNKKFDELKTEDDRQIESHKKQIEEKNLVIESLEQVLEQLKQEKERIESEHDVKLNELTIKHTEELENLQFEMLKCVHDVQKALDEEKKQNELKIKNLEKTFETERKNLKESFENEIEILKNQHVARMEQLEENMNEMKLLSEIQAKEKCAEVEGYWKGQLEEKIKESADILKECQAISEYTIIQTELEKNEFRSQLETKTKQYKELESKYDDIYFNYKQLQASYSNVQSKLYRSIKELREKETLKHEINKLLHEKHTYEATILRIQETIDILKRRLTESDTDVEQLKKEVSENEEKLLEYENQFNILSIELEKARKLGINNETTIKEEIYNVKDDLLTKVNDFKKKTEEFVDKYREELNKKEKEQEELLKFIKDQQMLHENAKEMINKADIELEKLTNENEDFSKQIETLNNENASLKRELENFNEQKEHWTLEKKELDFKIDILKNDLDQWRKQEQELKNSIDRVAHLENVCESFDKEISEKNSRISNLNKELDKSKSKCDHLEKMNEQYVKKIEEQVALIAPFKEQLESYELEMNNLQSAKECMENEAKDLSNKYAQILGHQNHKQKIKYMVNLKTKNDELLKSNLDLESKIRSMEKKMEKLKKENLELKRNSRKPSLFDDKENIASPNKSFKCESPGPLREKN